MENASKKKKYIFQFSIKQKIYGVALSTLIVFFVFAIITLFSINRVVYYNKYDSLTKDIDIQFQQLKQLNMKFLQNEVNTPLFYESGKSPIIDDFYSVHKQTDSLLMVLLESRIINKVDAHYFVEKVILELNQYEQEFISIADKIKLLGYKDYGTYGALKENADKTVAFFESLNNDQLLSKVLYLRSNEKDFIINKRLKHQDDFRKNYLEIKENLKNFENDSINGYPISKVNESLDKYYESFSKLAIKEIAIGLTSEQGLKGNLTSVEERITPLVSTIKSRISEEKRKKLFVQFSFLCIVFILFIIVILFSSHNIISSIIYPIESFRTYINRMSSGAIPKEKPNITGKNEVTQMADSLYSLLKRNKETALFAQEIGKGNLEAEFKSLSKDDILGNALLEMRKSLLKTSCESNERKIIEDKQNWQAKGLAEFADILRTDTKNLEELSFNIISKLVQYLDAVQGGFYLINDDKEDEKFIELKSSYAYNRRKFNKKTIRWGEGLIGSCVLEGKTIHMKSIPEDYLYITSGLGHSTPSNLLIIPIGINDEIFGVLEIATLNSFETYQIKFIESLAENIASTLSSIRINLRTAKLLKETQEQANTIQQNEEEMRQNMEEMQATQEEKFRKDSQFSQLAETIDKAVGIIEYNQDGIILNANDIFCKKTSYSKSELIGNDYTILYADENYKQSESYKEFWDKMLKGEVHSGLYKKQTKEGIDLFVQCLMKPFFDKLDKLEKVIEIEIDITKFKEQEIILRERTDLFLTKEEAYQNEINNLKKKLKDLQNN